LDPAAEQLSSQAEGGQNQMRSSGHILLAASPVRRKSPEEPLPQFTESKNSERPKSERIQEFR
jgi:hypothetical protein